jgi:hypothetical protein
MASKNIDFPASSNSYSSKVVEPSPLDNALYLPVPGPEGRRGPKGDVGPTGPRGESGPQGIAGPQGPSGKDGKDGRDGKNGKDGQSYLPVYGQGAGWGRYANRNRTAIKLGSSRGIDGWEQVSISLDKDLSNESNLPEKSVSLYNNYSNSINLKHLKVGSQVSITIDMDIETFMPGTEIWSRVYLVGSKATHDAFVATPKYQHTYSIRHTQKIFIENSLDKSSNALLLFRADLDCLIYIKNIIISVS